MGLDTGFEDVPGDKFTQTPAIKIPNPVGAKVAPIAEHRDSLRNCHDFIESVTHKDRGNILTLELVDRLEKRLDFLVGK